MQPEIVYGDLLEQPVQAIVNAWNRNLFPWWLLLTQGVAAAVKRRAGTAPFRELARLGPIPLGGAVVTGPGNLACRAIIHVAGIDLLWRSSERSVIASVSNAMELVARHNFASVAFPVIGAGSGLGEKRALAAMVEAFGPIASKARVIVVRYEVRRR